MIRDCAAGAMSEAELLGAARELGVRRVTIEGLGVAPLETLTPPLTSAESRAVANAVTLARRKAVAAPAVAESEPNEDGGASVTVVGAPAPPAPSEGGKRFFRGKKGGSRVQSGLARDED